MAAAIVPMLIGTAVSAAASKLLAPKAKAAQVNVPQAPQIRANSQVADVLSARRGTRANQRTGSRGAEAPGGMKSKLGQ